MAKSKMIKPKMAEAAMSGTLISFGKFAKLGSFTQKSVMYAKGVQNLARSIYYFVPRGNSAGAGRLSAGMAADAAMYVRESILGDGREWRYKGPPLSSDYNKNYRDWKDKVYGSKPVMLLTGNLANSIAASKKNGGLGWSVHVKDNLVDSPVVGTGLKGVPLKFKKISPASYGYKHEMGINTPKRPIISGSMLGWISERSPKWAKLFERYMAVLWESGSKEDITSSGDRYEPAPNSPRVDQGSGASGISDANRSLMENVAQLEYYANQFEEAAAYLNKLSWMSRNSGKTIAAGSKEEKLLESLIRSELPKANGDEISKIVEAIRTGKVPKISEDMV